MLYIIFVSNNEGILIMKIDTDVDRSLNVQPGKTGLTCGCRE
jgi:hypothetical protein